MPRDIGEINDQINEAIDSEEQSLYPAMTYEQGVISALRWVTGESDDTPMED